VSIFGLFPVGALTGYANPYCCVLLRLGPNSGPNGAVAGAETTQMKILKALVFDAAGKTPPAIRDAIEYKGQLWLVPGWYEIPAKAVSKPVRLIPLDRLRYQKTGQQGMDLIVNDGLPIQLFDREIPIELRNKFQVLEGPDDLEIPGGGGRVQ
jgi:hypothetical protein